MAVKRFWYDFEDCNGAKIVDFKKDKRYPLGTVGDFRDVEELLNSLNDENEQLKIVNTHLKNELSWIKDYAYWKEKDAFNKLFGAYMETCDEYRMLVKENGQLYELLDFANTLFAFEASESCQKKWEKRLKELKSE